MRESGEQRCTAPAMQFTICYGLFFCYHLFQVPMKRKRSFQTVGSFLVFKYFSKSCLNYTLFQTSYPHSRQKDWGAKGIYNAVSSFCVLVRPGKQADLSKSNAFSTCNIPVRKIRTRTNLSGNLSTANPSQTNSGGLGCQFEHLVLKIIISKKNWKCPI